MMMQWLAVRTTFVSHCSVVFSREPAQCLLKLRPLSKKKYSAYTAFNIIMIGAIRTIDIYITTSRINEPFFFVNHFRTLHALRRFSKSINGLRNNFCVISILIDDVS